MERDLSLNLSYKLKVTTLNDMSKFVTKEYFTGLYYRIFLHFKSFGVTCLKLYLVTESED